MKFKFEMNDNDEYKAIVEFETDLLGDIEEYFKNFLKGCGFVVNEDKENE